MVRDTVAGSNSHQEKNHHKGHKGHEGIFLGTKYTEIVFRFQPFTTHHSPFTLPIQIPMIKP